MPTYIAIYNPIHPHQRHLHHWYILYIYVNIQVQYPWVNTSCSTYVWVNTSHLPLKLWTDTSQILCPWSKRSPLLSWQQVRVPVGSRGLTRGTVHCTNCRTTTTSEALSVDTKYIIIIKVHCVQTIENHRYMQTYIYTCTCNLQLWGAVSIIIILHQVTGVCFSVWHKG